jgi:hypothetical protein
MGLKKIDLKIQAVESKESNQGNISVRVPKALELAFYKIPAEPRNALIRRLIEDFVKENAS